MLAETESKPLSDIRAVSESAQPQSVATSIDAFLFYSLLAVIALAAIPYGSVEPWWKALFQCLVFALAGLSVIEKLLQPDERRHDYRLFFPILALMVFAFFQTLPWFSSSLAGTESVGARTLSADVFQTRLFIIHLAALILAG